ncbi:MAG: PAS domain S-box protein [Victivallales bacterium]|nr:PAS domain S-box protein [Victivallales bacterium]
MEIRKIGMTHRVMIPAFAMLWVLLAYTVEVSGSENKPESGDDRTAKIVLTNNSTQIVSPDPFHSERIDVWNLAPGVTAPMPQQPDFFDSHREELLLGGGLLIGLLLVIAIIPYLKRQTQRKMETIFAHSPMRTLVISENGHVLYCHIPKEGLDSQSLKVNTISDLPFDVRERFINAVKETFATGEKIKFNYEMFGAFRRAEFSRLPDDNPFHSRAVLCTSSDITELHHTRNVAAQTAEHLKLTLNSIGDGVIATDTEERITLINPVATALTGYNADEAIGKKLDEIFNIVNYIDNAKVESPIRKALTKKEIVQLANHTDLIAKDGTRRHIADSAAPIIGQNGELSGGVLVFRDVTDDYKKRDELNANSVILKNASKIARFMYFRYVIDGEVKQTSFDPDVVFWPLRDGRPIPAKEWVAAEDLEEFTTGWRALCNGELSQWQMVYSCGSKGNKRYFNIRVEASVGMSDQNRSLYGIVQEITEARQNELLYRDALSLFEAILDNLPGFVFVKNIDDDMRYMVCNRKFYEITGTTPEKVIGGKDNDVFPMDEQRAKKIEKIDGDLASKGETLDVQEEFINGKGEKIVVRTIKSVITRSDGTRLLIGTGADISHRRELEKEQLHTIEMLNSYINSERIINRSLAGVLLEKDFDSAVNNMLAVIGEQSGADRCYVFRYLDDELNRCDNIYEWVRGGIDSQQENLRNLVMDVTPNWSRILSAGEDIIIPDVSNPPEGLEPEAEFLALQNIRSLLASGIWVDGKLYGFVGFDFVRRRREFADSNVHMVRSIVNIYLLARERFLQQEQLADRASLQRQIVDNIAIPIVILDPEYNIVMTNPSIQRMTGRPAHELLGQKCYEYVCRHPEPPQWCPMRQTLKTNAMYQGEVFSPDGIHRFSVMTQPIFDRNGKLIYVLKSEIDITDFVRQKQELQVAMEQAQAANRAKSFFLATVSHELRTPLNAVIGFSELLRSGAVSASEQNEYLNSINFAGNALLNLINDVLDLSKLEADQMNIVPIKVDIERLVRETVSVFKLKAQEKNLSLTVDCQTHGLSLYLDHLRLRQVILNLVGNAMKFTLAGGVKIDVKFDPSTDGDNTGDFMIRVADTGIGISPEGIRKVFEPFVQDESTRGTHIYEGSGLGLAISQKLIAKMGGVIELESTPGKGSTFTIKIPKVRYEAAQEDAPQRAEKVVHVEGKTFVALLVDDVQMNLKVLQAILKKIDIECVLANSGDEALAQLDAKPNIDLVLTDLWMPKMNGAELAKRIKRNPKTAKIPVVAVTADTQAVTESESEFSDIIFKPITLDSLRKVIGKVLAVESIAK